MSKKIKVITSFHCIFCNNLIKNCLSDDPLYLLYTCTNCGNLKLEKGIANKINDNYKFANILRNKREQGEGTILIESSNLEELLKNYKSHSVLDKLNSILIYLADKSDFPGKEIPLSKLHDYTIAGCKNPAEFIYLIKHLIETGELENYSSKFGKGSEILTSERYDVSLSVLGWKKVYELKNLKHNSVQAFIAMWFDESTNSVYENGIRTAIIDTGHLPMRIDLKEHINIIPDEIIAEIRRSKFLIADFTGQRHGVYFEAGFAFGLGIPVIWMCKKEEIENLHFDIKQYNHIVWTDEKDLYRRLYNRIRAVII